MAVVPRKVESDVALRPVTDAKFATVETGQMGDAIGRGLQKLGAGAADYAQAQDRIESAYDQAAAKALDNQAATRIRDMLWTGDSAFYSKQGFDALNARPVVEKGINDLREEMIGQAKTERQRAMFGRVFDQRAGQEREGIARYSVAQTQQEEQKQSYARQTLAAQNAVLASDDPVAFGTNVNTGLGEIRSLADAQGWSPERLAVEEKKFSSGVYASIAQRKALTDPAAGKAYLDTHRDKVDPDTAFSLDKQFQPYLDQQQAYGDVARIMGLPAPSMANGEAQPVVGSGSLFGNIVANESGGRQFAANGKPLTSSKGAVGVAQVMPSTGPEAARLAGVPWDANRFHNDADYNRRLGEAYWNAQLRKYGDPQLAAAAYNAGPGRLDAALADARKDGDGDWLRRMPPETRAYVGKFNARNGAVGAQQAPERHDLNQLYSRVDAVAEREGWTFERRERAKEQVDKYVARDERLLARQEADAQRSALDAIQKKGDAFTSTSQIPPAVWAKLAPDDRLRFQSMAEQNAKPKAIAADGTQALTLNLMAINEPEKFKSTDLRMFQGTMTPGEFASLATLQAKARANPNAPEMVDHSRIWGTIKDYAPDLGLDLGQKDGKWKDEKARASATRIFSTMQRDLNAVTGGKRQPTDDEIKRSFDAATLQVQRVTPGWLWGEHTETIRRYEANPGESVRVTMPTSVRDRIVSSYQRTQRRNPSETEIARIYYNHKGQAGFWQ